MDLLKNIKPDYNSQLTTKIEYELVVVGFGCREVTVGVGGIEIGFGFNLWEFFQNKF